MADIIREVQCYIILDTIQEKLEMPQKLHEVTEIGKDEKEVIRQKTVIEAYPKARKSLSGKKLVIPVEVGPGEEFEIVYAAMKAKFGKKIMAHKETIATLDNDEWREKEVVAEKEVTK